MKMNQTIDYYNTHANDFVQDTLAANMHLQQDAFLACLPAQAHILDLGAGSGRDSLYFMKLGCLVTMVDGSDAMCKACEKLTGQKAIHSTFLDFETQEKYDGVWACASLLHLHKEEIPVVLSHLAGMLKKPNTLYLSFKYGDFEGPRNGRYFTDLTEEGLASVILKTNTLKLTMEHGNYKVDRQFITKDVRPGRTERWLNAFVHLGGRKLDG